MLAPAGRSVSDRTDDVTSLPISRRSLSVPEVYAPHFRRLGAIRAQRQNMGSLATRIPCETNPDLFRGLMVRRLLEVCKRGYCRSIERGAIGRKLRSMTRAIPALLQ